MILVPYASIISPFLREDSMCKNTGIRRVMKAGDRIVTMKCGTKWAVARIQGLNREAKVNMSVDNGE